MMSTKPVQLGRHQLRAAQQRLLRSRAFDTWDILAAA
jgi:hypothetical protein